MGEHAATHVFEWMMPDSIGLFAMSPLVLPKYDDLPPHYASRAHWTGFWVVSQQEQLTLSEKVNGGLAVGRCTWRGSFALIVVT